MPHRVKLALPGAAALIALLAISAAAALSPRGLETFAFYLFGGVAAVSGLGCVLSRDIVRCAAWLLGALAATAGLFLLLSATFLAAAQLVVYAGGILVLIVFGVMLTARGHAPDSRPSRVEVAVAAASIGLLLGGLALLTWRAFSPAGDSPATVIAGPDVRALGAALLTTYWLPLLMLAFLLLAVMIGAAHLARPEKKR